MIPTILFACLEFLSRKISYEQLATKFKDTKAITYKDEVGNKKIISPLTRKAVRKSVRFADSEHDVILEKDEKEELMKGRRSCGSNYIDELLGERERMNVTRVKVKMTKEEAAKLLSKFKCKEGGVLPFKDVASELVALPMDRVTILST